MRWRASAGISARSYARRSRWEDQPGGRGRRCSAWVRAVVAAYAASAARVGLRKIAPSWSATMRPWKSAHQGRVHGEAARSPRRARLSASALRVARWLAEPKSCCAGSHASCMRKDAERRAARYGMERAEEGGGPRVRSQSWEAVESEAKRAAPDQPRRVNMAAILAIHSASVEWPARAWRPSQPR